MTDPRLRPAAAAAAALVSVLALAAPGAAAPAPSGAPVLLQPADPFDPDHPFPTARHLDPVTGRLRVPDWVLDADLPAGAAGERVRAVFAALRPGLEELDGAGLSAEVSIRVRGARSAVGGGALAASVRVLAADGGDGPEIRVRLEGDRLRVRPVGIWEPGARYVVVALAPRDDSAAAARDAIVERLLGAEPLDDADLEAERRRVRAAVIGAGIEPSRVRVAFSLRIRSIEPDLRRLRATLDARADRPGAVAVERTVTGADVKGLAADTAVARVVYGTYESPEMRGADGIFVPDRVAGRAEPPLLPIRFALALPRAPRSDPCPVVMGLHGLGSDIDGTLPRHAEWLARAGFAYVTIDGVGHGSRRRGALGAHLSLLDFDDARRTRDALRQTLVDLAALRQRIGAGLSVDGGRTRAVAREGVLWSGGSYGGIFGLMLAAFDPALRAAHVEGCGGPWRDVIGESIAAPMFGTYFSIRTGLAPRSAPSERAVTRWLELSQWIIDPGDPTAFAPFLIRRPLGGGDGARPRVLVQLWSGDGVMSRVASERLARAAGWPAVVWPAPRWGVRAGEAAHQAFWAVPEARAQALGFLASGGKRVEPASPGPAY